MGAVLAAMEEFCFGRSNTPSLEQHDSVKNDVSRLQEDIMALEQKLYMQAKSRMLSCC